MSKRSTMNISLPASLKKWVDARVKRDGFGTASEFVRHLVREEKQRQRAQLDHIDDLIDEGLASGPGRPMTDADWESIRQKGRKVAAARAGAARRKSA